MPAYDIPILVFAVIGFFQSCHWVWQKFVKNRGPSIEFALAFCRDKWRHGYHSGWTKLISQTKNDAYALIVLEKFIETYDFEQRSSIENASIVTTFEAYSALVKEVVTKVKETAPASSRVYGVTTLALPIVQWQNFGRIGYAERLSFFAAKHVSLPCHFNKANEKWDKYLEFLTNLFWNATGPSEPHAAYSRNEGSLSLFRYIISFAPSVIHFLERKKVPWPKEIYGARTSEEAQRQLCSWILCGDGDRPVHVSVEDVKRTLEAFTFDEGYDRNIAIDFYSANNERPGKAYMIVPPEALVEPPPRVGGGFYWTRLGDVFAELYQNQCQNLFLTTVDDMAFSEYYAPDSQKALPQDFFLVGYGPPKLEKDDDIFNAQKVNWVFGLSAIEMDRDLNKVRLSFFVREWHTGRSQLDELLEFGRMVLAPPEGTIHQRTQLGSRRVRDLLMSAEGSKKLKETDDKKKE